MHTMKNIKVKDFNYHLPLIALYYLFIFIKKKDNKINVDRSKFSSKTPAYDAINKINLW